MNPLFIIILSRINRVELKFERKTRSNYPISLLWSLTSIISITQAVDVVLYNIPAFSYLDELFDTTSEVWIDFSMEAREWLSFGFPAETAIYLGIITFSALSLVIVYGLFSGKSWSFKPAFALPFLSMITSFAAISLYLSAPFELFFDPQLKFNVIFLPINLIWTLVIFLYLPKPKNRQYLFESVIPAPLSIPLVYSGTCARALSLQ